MKKYEYRNEKIYYSNESEFIKEINKITHTRILHIEDDISNKTSTDFCKRIYWETEVVQNFS